MRIGTFGHQVALGPWLTRSDELHHQLPDAIADDAPTPLWRAVDEAMNGFDEVDDARRVVLVLSDGKDSGPIGFRQRIVSQVEVIDRARREDVMIYGVGMGSRGARPMLPGAGLEGLQAALRADLPDPGLARAAEESGGGYIEIGFNRDLGAAFAQVADELHSQYLLGFVPPKRDGKVHDVDVRLKTRGLEARARKSYVAPKDSK
jgi:VWFA-related protein